MSRTTFSARPFVVALAGAALIGAASGALADRLLPASSMPETRLNLVSSAGARAFDHIRAARQHIELRQAFEARQELAQARKLLSEARGAVPANRVQDRIGALLARIDDPSAKLKYTDVDPIYAEIEAAGGGEPYAATWRYVERARFQLWNQDRNAATRELLAASARVPYGRIDGPLGASYERVNQAMILLYDHDLEGADALLTAAEDNAHAVVQIAAGVELPMAPYIAPDVAAPAAPPSELAPEPEPEIVPEAAPAVPATESEIPAEAEFRESTSVEPALREGLPDTAEEAMQEMAPALPDVAAPEVTTPALAAPEVTTPALAAPEVTAPEVPATAEALDAQVEAIEAQAEAIEDAAEAQAEAAEAAAEAIGESAEAQAEAVEEALEAQVEAGQISEEAAEAQAEAAEAAAEAIEDAAEAQAEAADAAAEAIEDVTEAQAEAAKAAAEAQAQAAEAAAEATEATQAAEEAVKALEESVQGATPALPDVAAPPMTAPKTPSLGDVPSAAGDAVEGAVEDAIEELAPEAQP